MDLSNFEHNRYITVALNDQGFSDINHRVMESDNIATYTLPPDEFDSLYDSGLLWTMNDHYDLMLDDYESRIISTDFDFLSDKAAAIKEICPIAFHAIDQACQLKSMISFDL